MTKLKAEISFYIAVAVCIVAASMPCLSQTPTPSAPRPGRVPPPARPGPEPSRTDRIKDHPSIPGVVDAGTYERSIAVDPKINVSVCVTEGSVKINGWNRNEVRVFVKDGSSVGFKILQKSARTGAPVWIMLMNMPRRNTPGPVSECIAGDDIEIDVPTEAAVKLKGRSARTKVDGFRKVSVTVGGGDISIQNITEGIAATTYEGDVMVGNSQGAMSLETTSGNIVAFGLAPSQVGDTFRAKTNSGAISLERLDYRQIEVNSISGTVLYNGRFEPGGLYSFATSNGTIALVVPGDSAATLTATYGFGHFASDLPLNDIRKGAGVGAKGLTAVMGSGGDAKLNLTTTSGQIRIRKQ